MLNNPFYQKIKQNIKERNTVICLGLDPDINLLPNHFPKNIKGIEQFLLEIIKNTADLVIAYKPNISFFEAEGIDGLMCLKRIIKQIPGHVPVILDGKRGDIGNTSKMQAKYIFDYFGADATTLHPYMGLDSLEPFFQYKDKYNFVLALTSNPGANDFEKCLTKKEKPLYQLIAKTCATWNESYNNIGLVVGATQNEMEQVRKIDPKLLFLIPGVGTQGGDYNKALVNGANQDNLVIINISRAILYASKDKNYFQKARKIILNYKK